MTLSAVCRQQFALKDIYSNTTKPRVLIFDMMHCIVDQVCSVAGPRVQTSPAVGVFSLKM